MNRQILTAGLLAMLSTFALGQQPGQFSAGRASYSMLSQDPSAAPVPLAMLPSAQDQDSATKAENKRLSKEEKKERERQKKERKRQRKEDEKRRKQEAKEHKKQLEKQRKEDAKLRKKSRKQEDKQIAKENKEERKREQTEESKEMKKGVEQTPTTQRATVVPPTPPPPKTDADRDIARSRDVDHDRERQVARSSDEHRDQDRQIAPSRDQDKDRRTARAGYDADERYDRDRQDRDRYNRSAYRSRPIPVSHSAPPDALRAQRRVSRAIYSQMPNSNVMVFINNNNQIVLRGSAPSPSFRDRLLQLAGAAAGGYSIVDQLASDAVSSAAGAATSAAIGGVGDLIHGSGSSSSPPPPTRARASSRPIPQLLRPAPLRIRARRTSPPSLPAKAPA